MSTPLIWIVFPLAIAIFLFFIRRWIRLTALIGIFVALLLAGLAWLLPVGKTLSLGAWFVAPPIRVVESMNVLGRQFILTNAQRPALLLIYLFIALWMGGAWAARAGRLFTPLGLALAVLLTATLAVKPFLYAALITAITSLVTVPLLSSPGKTPGRGVLRFLTFQILGMPLILLAGWLLTESSATSPTTSANIAGVLAGLGLAIIASVFPFHTWIPMIAEETHPYVTGFILFFFPTIISLFSLNFILQYINPVNPSTIWQILRLMGILMVLLGGIWSAFQTHLGRMMGFAIIAEIGFFLLTLSLYPEFPQTGLTNPVGINLAQIFPRGISMAIWALSLASLSTQTQSLNFSQVKGVARQYPIITVSLILAQFSLAGLPLLASFPVRLALWTTLASRSYLVALLAILGSAGLLLAGVRTLAVFVTGEKLSPWKISETPTQKLLLIIGWLILFAIGIFPQIILEPMSRAAQIFMP